jgi:hypothetical protein
MQRTLCAFSAMPTIVIPSAAKLLLAGNSAQSRDLALPYAASPFTCTPAHFSSSVSVAA